MLYNLDPKYLKVNYISHIYIVLNHYRQPCHDSVIKERRKVNVLYSLLYFRFTDSAQD